MRSFLRKLFWGVILNSFALFLSEKLLKALGATFIFQGQLAQLIGFSLILTLLNLLIKPILRRLFSPLVWLTLGLFSLVINLLILKLATLLLPNLLVIDSLLSWFLASFIISFFNSLIARLH